MKKNPSAGARLVLDGGTPQQLGAYEVIDPPPRDA
jgi:hypothetical protein